MNNDNKSNIFAFLLGLAAGVAGAVYLSNESNRKQIMDKYNQAKDTVSNKANDLQEKAAGVVDKAQSAMNDKAEGAKTKLRDNADR